MKPLVKTILLLLLPFFAFGQRFKINVDSIKQALKTPPTDSVAFKLNYQLADNYSESNRDSALFFAEICLTLAQRNNKTLDEAGVISLMGYQFLNLGKLSESYEYISKALKIAENPQNDGKTFESDTSHPKWTLDQMRLNFLADIHHNFGHLMGSMGKTDERILHYKETINISETIRDTALLGFANMNLGEVYNRLGKLDSALLMEQNAEKMFIQTNQKSYLCVVYEIIGQIFLKQQKNVLAVQYFHKGIQSAIEQNNEAELGDIYGALTHFYLETEKNRDSSLHYALKRLEVLKSMGSKNLGYAYSTLSGSYELNNKTDSAFKYSKLALQSLGSTLGARIESLTKAQSLAFDDQLKLKAIEKENADAQNKRRTWALLAGLGFMFLVGFLLYRNNIQKQKANLILQEQKEKIESTLTQLKSTQAQLIQSEKLASLGELTAGIAHEIQNPMNFVNNFAKFNIGIADELDAEINKPNIDKEYIAELLTDLKGNQEKINFHGNRASSIVSGMLEHSRTNTAVKGLTDINKLCEEYFRLAFHGLRAKDKNFNCDMVTHFDESIPEIEIVGQDVGRVVLNLINNAFYAVNERSKNSNLIPNNSNLIGTSHLIGSVNYKPTVTVTTQKTDNSIEVRVKDNGTGISDAVKEKIFQPFFTTKPTGSGTGLGLSLAYDIITKGHDGTLKVESEEGVGSEFVISLPIKTNAI